MAKKNIYKSHYRNRPIRQPPNMRLLLAVAGIGFLVFGAVTMLSSQEKTSPALSANLQYDTK